MVAGNTEQVYSMQSHSIDEFEKIRDYFTTLSVDDAPEGFKYQDEVTELASVFVYSELPPAMEEKIWDLIGVSLYQIKDKNMEKGLPGRVCVISASDSPDAVILDFLPPAKDRAGSFRFKISSTLKILDMKFYR